MGTDSMNLLWREYGKKTDAIVPNRKEGKKVAEFKAEEAEN